ncbi:MAG: hypothetical protein EXS22_01670 [Pedosphaera sp.]|nr:hypothetical protein [Pedosphaera sp.]MSU42734.1 hypothetical protein [Pedosphaera sp.]
MRELIKTPCAVVALLVPLLAIAAGGIVVKSVRPAGETPAKPIRVAAPGTAGEVRLKPQIIELLNGDSLSGGFIGYDAEKGARWKHEAVNAEIAFTAAAIGRIRLNTPPSAEAPARQNCRVRLRNGDEVQGEMMMLNNDTLSLETWYGGMLNVPRAEIESIAPGAATQEALYDGPTDLKGWTGGNLQNGEAGLREGKGMPVPGANGATPPGWLFRNESFYANGPGPQIGRMVKFTDMVNIEFDLAWRGYFQIAVHMYADRLEQYSGNAYVVGINPGNVYLIRMTAREGQNNIGNGNIQELQQKNKARFSIRVDKKNKNISLLVDGVLKQQWKDANAFAGGGDGLMFISQGNGMVKLSKLRVTEWDGKMPSANAAAGGKATEDIARLTNNDSVTGQLRGVKEGKVHFFSQSIGQELAIPIARVARIELAKPAGEPAKPAPGSVRAVFAHGGALTFNLEKWEGDQVSGTSSALGKVTLRPTAITQLDFNLQQKRPDSGDPFDF